jgi:hypothetical protein
LCLQIVTKQIGNTKTSIESDVSDLYLEIKQCYIGKETGITYTIEELITPLVYASISQKVIGSDKIRGVIENACGIFKTSLGSNPVSSEQLSNFFKCTFQYLLQKSDSQAR